MRMNAHRTPLAGSVNPPRRAAKQLFSTIMTFLLCSNDSQSKHIYGAKASPGPTQSVESWRAHFSYWRAQRKLSRKNMGTCCPPNAIDIFTYFFYVKKHSDGHCSRRHRTRQSPSIDHLLTPPVRSRRSACVPDGQGETRAGFSKVGVIGR
jgi:hypothetical protein